MFDAVVITCEHAGNEVPERYRRLFAGKKRLLATHRGYDPGALELARRIARSGRWPLHFSTTTRLLVDLNRSFRHRQQFSEITAALDWDTKSEILDDHYDPYRFAVEKRLRERIHDEGQRVLHLSVHTFTPELDGKQRRADVGLLYDPWRSSETDFCNCWRDQLQQRRPDLIVRRNYPYLGTADGFTSHLRFFYGSDVYAGIELEVNQRWPQGNAAKWNALQADLVQSLRTALGGRISSVRPRKK